MEKDNKDSVEKKSLFCCIPAAKMLSCNGN